MMREGIRVKGIVQGVGFRPFVARIAKQHGVSGFVYNDSEGVFIEVEGEEKNIESFCKSLGSNKPPLAIIESINRNRIHCKGEREFVIISSHEGSEANTLLAPDTAPCDACMKEFLSSANRRYQYSFINCTHCGPRYSLIEHIPYDRKYTTMNDFAMCEKCHSEYTAVEDRRFHAEPTCCPQCGPKYFAILPNEQMMVDDDEQNSAHESNFVLAGSELSMKNNCTISIHDEERAIKWAKQALKDNKIVAMKGIGGYHLLCNATSEETVKRLRLLKKRPAKPLAVMIGSLEMVMQICEITEAEKKLLLSKERPIVLLRPKKNSPISPSVTMGIAYIGVMLPYAPIHYRLLDDDSILVCTSANNHGNPVIYEDYQASSELLSISDGILMNNRRIAAPTDDSVMMIYREEPMMVRRSRGFVPLPIKWNKGKSLSLLATGSDLKNTFSLLKEDNLFVGPHMGDLQSFYTHERYEKTIHHMEELFSVQPQLVVSDMHPNYFSSRFGKEYAQKRDISHFMVQHHVAHIASVMAEYNLDDTVLGIALDGTGYGTDGAVWGGEILEVSTHDFKRLAHIAYSPLPSGEEAVKEPWRQSLWYLRTLYGKDLPSVYEKWVESLPKNWHMLDTIICRHIDGDSRIRMVPTSSAGRLFDVVGSLLGFGIKHEFDGHIPMMLEYAANYTKGDILPYQILDGECYEISFLDTLHAICESFNRGVHREQLSASFHRTMAHSIVHVAKDLLSKRGYKHILLSGGVFQNRYLLKAFYELWPEAPFLLPRMVPVNDGGLSVGQAWLAMHRLRKL